MAFEVGPLSTVAAQGLALAVLLYAGATGLYAARGFQNRLTDRWSAASQAVVMGAMAGVLWTRGAALLPAPFSIALLVVFALGIGITLTWTLGKYQVRVDHFVAAAGARMNALLEEVLPEDRYAHLQELRDRFELSHEERRKRTHLVMGLLVVTQLFLGHLVLRGVWLLLGSPGADATESRANVYQALQDGVLASGHVMTLTVLLALVFLFLPNELLRLTYPELSYPFKATILRSLRERESGLFGAHYYIVASSAFGLLVLGLDGLGGPGVYSAVALIAIAVFADAASALFGVRWGRAKWFHNRGKSYIGTLGGTLVAFLVALPVTGPIGALVGAAGFFLVDVLAPVPFPVSDNVLNPVVLAVLYTLTADQVHPIVPGI